QQQARDGHDELHAGLLGARARSIASARGAEARARVTKLRGVFPPLRGGKESRYCSPTIRPRAVTTTQRPSWRLISSTRPTPGSWSAGSISIMPERPSTSAAPRYALRSTQPSRTGGVTGFDPAADAIDPVVSGEAAGCVAAAAGAVACRSA